MELRRRVYVDAPRRHGFRRAAEAVAHRPRHSTRFPCRRRRAKLSSAPLLASLRLPPAHSPTWTHTRVTQPRSEPTQLQGAGGRSQLGAHRENHGSRRSLARRALRGRRTAHTSAAPRRAAV
jgi:hypothetical protein